MKVFRRDGVIADIRLQWINTMTNGKMAWLFWGPYWRMSYRNRFLYDLWMTPVVAAIMVGFVWWWFRPTETIAYWSVTMLAVVVGVSSAAYNYIRWQSQVRNGKQEVESNISPETDLT